MRSAPAQSGRLCASSATKNETSRLGQMRSRKRGDQDDINIETIGARCGGKSGMCDDVGKVHETRTRWLGPCKQQHVIDVIGAKPCKDGTNTTLIAVNSFAESQQDCKLVTFANMLRLFDVFKVPYLSAWHWAVDRGRAGAALQGSASWQRFRPGIVTLPQHQQRHSLQRPSTHTAYSFAPCISPFVLS